MRCRRRYHAYRTFSKCTAPADLQNHSVQDFRVPLRASLGTMRYVLGLTGMSSTHLESSSSTTFTSATDGPLFASANIVPNFCLFVRTPSPQSQVAETTCEFPPAPLTCLLVASIKSSLYPHCPQILVMDCYRPIKRATESTISWLVETALECGCNVHFLPNTEPQTPRAEPPKQPRFRGKARWRKTCQRIIHIPTSSLKTTLGIEPTGPIGNTKGS